MTSRTVSILHHQLSLISQAAFSPKPPSPLTPKQGCSSSSRAARYFGELFHFWRHHLSDRAYFSRCTDKDKAPVMRDKS